MSNIKIWNFQNRDLYDNQIGKLTEWLSSILLKKQLLVVVVYMIGGYGFNLINPSYVISPKAEDNSLNMFSKHEVLSDVKYLPLVQHTSDTQQTSGWPMVAANLERTSWTPEEVSGNLHVEWYRPIEAYIPQNVQIIASDGKLFVSTASGLYALRAEDGSLVWRFDTEMPLGNSPTVSNGVLYVGGYDRKLHALDVETGDHLWAFDGASAGFDTNPLVIDGKIYAGNRDGYMYAVGAHGTMEQGQLIWKYKTGGSIHISAAYKDGVIYFASNDNFAYSLNAEDGELLWKSEKLPGDGFHSYWPVVFRDKVIFSGSSGYRYYNSPGTRSVSTGDEYGYDQIYSMDKDGIWSDAPDGTLIGQEVLGQDWSHGYPVLDASRIVEYYEDNSETDPYKYKPWRRVVIVLNSDDGSEYTFDSDGDGFLEYIPVTMWGTHSGNRYPPVVGADDMLYIANIYQKLSIPQGRMMGWNPDQPSYLSVLRGQGAVDEKQAISSGGNIVYRSISSDRVGDWMDILDPTKYGFWWHYSSPLYEQAPGYDEMMWLWDPNTPERMYGSYGNINGLYFSGAENPIIPYQGRVYIHRSNAIIAYGSNTPLGRLPTLTINDAEDEMYVPTTIELRDQLEAEILKIISVGHLRPGYMNSGQYAFRSLVNYFENPGETLYTLTRAYPHLSPVVQGQLKPYLWQEFHTYFNPIMYSTIGWADGAPRESMVLPPEVSSDMQNYPPREASGGWWSWQYPQYNFYAMWKYAEIFPEEASEVYNLAKGKLEVPLSSFASDDYLIERTWELNGYIAGLIGFLELQEQAGMSEEDSQLRDATYQELYRLLQLLLDNFSKDTPWVDLSNIHKRHFNISRNFMMLVPELGDYLNQNLYNEVVEAVDEYEYIAPYWFVSRYEAVHDEGVISILYNYSALFQAKAYILKEPKIELSKYLDVPAFDLGDLFYIQNLVATLEASEYASQIHIYNRYVR